MRTNVRMRIGVATLAVLTLIACAPEEPAEVDDPAETPPEPGAGVAGTFTGDPELEGGCAWVEAADGERYEVMWPEGYEVSWEPLELHGPDGEVIARDGDEVRVTGTVAEAAASICMVGPIFEARSVEAT